MKATKALKPSKMGLHSTIRFTVEPEGVVSGQKGIFTVEAKGEGLTYRWQYSRPNGSWYNTTMEGAATAELQVEAHMFRNGYSFRCIVTDVTGAELISNAAVLTVTEATIDVSAPADATVTDGETAQFSVEAVEGYTYRWQYRRPNGSWYDTAMEGCHTATLSVPSYMGRDGYEFRCVVGNGYGSEITTEAAKLTVAPFELRFTVQPVDANAVEGKAQFTAELNGEVLRYQWMYCRPNGSWYETAMEGCNTDTLTVEAIAARDGFSSPFFFKSGS